MKPTLEIRINPGLRITSAFILGNFHGKRGTELHPKAPEEFDQGYSQRFKIVSHENGFANASTLTNDTPMPNTVNR